MTKRDWKAITIDYAAMAGYDDSTPIALCLTQRQVAILKACLIPQYWETRWDNLTLDAQELNELISEIDYALIVECGDVDCNDVMDCVDADGAYIALTGYQLDYLVSVSKARDEALDTAYDGTAQSIGADIPTGTPDTTEQNALCYAIEHFVDFWAASKRAQISLASGWRVALDDIQSAAIEFYNWIAPYVTPSYLADIFSCFVDFATAFAGLADEGERELFACCLYEDLDGVIMTEANFNIAISACASSLSGTAGDIACVFAGDTGLDMYLVFLTGYQIAIERLAASENLPCDCTAWCYHFDFEAAQESWTNRSSDSRPFGVWTSGVGWQSVWGSVGGFDERLYIERDFTAVHVTQVKMTFNLVGTGGNSRHWTLQAKLAGSLKSQMTIDYLSLPTDGTPIVAVLNVYEPIDEIEQSLVGDAAGDGDIDLTITECIVRGNGTNPFGTTNCT